ncbi:MAG: AarF/UbiB family protein [Desulfobacterales bacterium]|jgi:ubiquinone biosynthesis protein
MFNLSEQILHDLAQDGTPGALREKLTTMAASVGEDAFVKLVAREIVERTRPQQTIPEVYGHYRFVVRDGIEFFLSQISCQRLIDLVISQLQLKSDVDTKERLVELAKRIPTLHKLGQIIARNPNIDPAVKKWLIQLENGCYGTPLEGILRRIDGQLAETGSLDRVTIQPVILSEASVAAVIPFYWNQPSAHEQIHGVFKVLKPGIRSHLEEELIILEKTGAFFEKNRQRYDFKNFKFLDIFQEVREIMLNEINLAAEQNYLVEAGRFYQDMEDIQIPQPFSLSTDSMTAMAYLNGPKIIDVDLNPEQRKRCVAVLFEALICRPLFSPHEESLYHGDPHAGNILAVNDPATGDLKIGLLDWTLAGRLTKRDRLKTVKLILAIIKKDLSSIRRAVKTLAVNDFMEYPQQRQAFRNVVLNHLQSSEFAGLSQMKKSFKLLEQLSFEGFVFPADLMLFRKAVFTLEGVLYDLDPSFDMDAAIMQYITALMTGELPMRFSNLFFPLVDRSENYPSLISNIELQSLMVHQYADAVKSSYKPFAGYFTAWSRIFGAH